MIRIVRGERLALGLLAALAGGARAQGASEPFHITRAWPSMGTMLTVTAWGDARDSAALLAAVRAARDSVRLVDSLMSDYSNVSELAAVNRAAGGAPVRVSIQTMDVLRQARLYWRLSGGAFDPTVGPLVAAWGFHGTRGRVPPAAELDSLRSLVGLGAVELDSVARTVRLPRRGMRLDLGGIAKGYALDLARAVLGAAPATGGMVDFGGNVLVFGHPPHGDRWRIGIRHPRRNGEILGVLELDSGAIATSGDYEHYYVIDGVRYPHLIDPRTGRPARGVIAATAIGPRGIWSDGLSATLYLVGPARGKTLADSLTGVAGIWVTAVPGADASGALEMSSRARGTFRRDSIARK